MAEMKKPKRKTFFNDEDGFTKDDLEKLVLIGLTIVSVGVALVMYIINGDITSNLVYLISAILTLMVTRKGLSYFKKESYYGKNASTDVIKANAEQNMYGNGLYGSNMGYGMGYDPYSTGMYGTNVYPNQGVYSDPSVNMGLGVNINANIPLSENQENDEGEI